MMQEQNMSSTDELSIPVLFSFFAEVASASPLSLFLSFFSGSIRIWIADLMWCVCVYVCCQQRNCHTRLVGGERVGHLLFQWKGEREREEAAIDRTSLQHHVSPAALPPISSVPVPLKCLFASAAWVQSLEPGVWVKESKSKLTHQVREEERRRTRCSLSRAGRCLFLFEFLPYFARHCSTIWFHFLLQWNLSLLLSLFSLSLTRVTLVCNRCNLLSCCSSASAMCVSLCLSLSLPLLLPSDSDWNLLCLFSRFFPRFLEKGKGNSNKNSTAKSQGVRGNIMHLLLSLPYSFITPSIQKHHVPRLSPLPHPAAVTWCCKADDV